jgi:hypothetical protein
LPCSGASKEDNRAIQSRMFKMGRDGRDTGVRRGIGQFPYRVVKGRARHMTKQAPIPVFPIPPLHRGNLRTDPEPTSRGSRAGRNSGDPRPRLQAPTSARQEVGRHGFDRLPREGRSRAWVGGSQAFPVYISVTEGGAGKADATCRRGRPSLPPGAFPSSRCALWVMDPEGGGSEGMTPCPRRARAAS